jgi:hypothetical protein
MMMKALHRVATESEEETTATITTTLYLKDKNK